jgi:hypothetical protein
MTVGLLSASLRRIANALRIVSLASGYRPVFDWTKASR